MLVLLFCCSPKQSIKPAKEESPEPKKIDLFEYFPIDKADSLELVQYWKNFLSNDFNLKNTLLDSVVCWNVQEHLKYNGDSDTMLFKACLSKYLLPLKNDPIWPMLHSSNFEVARYKLESESDYKYGISFPRRPNWTEHFFTYTFYFVRTSKGLNFQGYTYN
jgi:hypothetical protein